MQDKGDDHGRPGSEINVSQENLELVSTAQVGEGIVQQKFDAAVSSSLEPDDNGDIINGIQLNVDAKNDADLSRLTSRSKRKIINDDSDESDDSRTATSLGKPKSSSTSVVNSESYIVDKANDVRSTRISRLQTSTSSKKRPTVHDESDDDEAEFDAPKKRRASTKSPVPEDSKAAIPKKMVPRKAESDVSASNKSSLLAQMQQPPSTKAPTNPLTKPARSGPMTTNVNTKKSPPAPTARSPTRPDSSRSSDIHVPRPHNPTQGPEASPKPTLTVAGTNVKWNEELVLKDLQDLCDRLSQESNFKLVQSGKIDLNGSFLPKEQERYEFFDTNERGEITVQSRIPMFPEDFTKGMKEHDLAWWGILDPAVGDGLRAAPDLQSNLPSSDIVPNKNGQAHDSRSQPPIRPPATDGNRAREYRGPQHPGWARPPTNAGDRSWDEDRSHGPPPLDRRGPYRARR